MRNGLLTWRGLHAWPRDGDKVRKSVLFTPANMTQHRDPLLNRSTGQESKTKMPSKMASSEATPLGCGLLSSSVFRHC